MSFAIMTDTSANIPTPIAVKEDITVIPLSFLVDGKEYTCTDTEIFDSKAYYEMLKSAKNVTTSQVNMQTYVDHMEPALKEGKDILFIGMSSGISGSYGSSKMAKRALIEQYPDRTIRRIDSLGASMGEGLLVLRAVECRKQGMDLEETAKLLKSEREKIYQLFTVDDLFFLRRGGRLSNASAIVGSLLQIKPVLKGNEIGKIVTIGKVRGRKAVIKHLADRFHELAVNPATSLVAISNCGCPEDAKILANLIKESDAVKNVMIVDHEPVTGSYLGPGALCIYFYGDSDIRMK